MHALVVYYSLSGMTEAVAKALAQELGADIEKIRCRRYSPGFLGVLRAGYDSWKGNLPPIEPLTPALSRYGLVVIGGPIWAFHPATPVRAYLRREASRLPRVAFFLTHGGSAARRSLDEMALLVGLAPAATLVVTERDIKGGKFRSAVSSFASTLQMKKAA